MQSFEIKLPKPKGEYISLFSVCCLHLGSKNCDKKKAIEYRDYILETKDTYVIDLGDDVDMALPGDQEHNSMLFECEMLPDEQFMAACEYWKPLVDSKKLLMTADSNHWWRVESKTGMSRARDLNAFLQNYGSNTRSPVPKKGVLPEWGRWQAMFKLVVGNIPYIVHAWHGAGGGGTPEGTIRRCREIARYVNADLYMMGHFHRKAIYEDIYFRWDDKLCRPVEEKRVYAATGSFLKWDDSYAERK
jgi:hypothetical protein